jgi:hypothetical protein
VQINARMYRRSSDSATGDFTNDSFIWSGYERASFIFAAFLRRGGGKG